MKPVHRVIIELSQRKSVLKWQHDHRDKQFCFLSDMFALSQLYYVQSTCRTREKIVNQTTAFSTRNQYGIVGNT